MKKIIAVIMSLVLTAGLAACSETDSSSDVSETSSIADTQSSSDDNQSVSDDTDSSTPDSSDDISSDNSTGGSSDHIYNDLPDDYDHSFDYTILDEDGNQIFIPEDKLDSELVERVYSLLFAAADGDEDKYFELFDIEEYTAAILGDDKSHFDDAAFSVQCDFEKESQRSNFAEISDYLDGSLTGRLRQIHFEKSDYLSTSSCEVYYLSFVAPSENCDLNVDATVYYNGGVMSVELELWSIVDHAYYDYEELIIKQMNAAASGDFETYMECACPDLYAKMLATLLSDGESVSDEDIEKLKELQKELCASSYDELNEALGKNFDGKVIQVQQFAEYDEDDYQSSEIKLYGRILLTVKNSDGEYQEVEGYCYSDGSQKGVWLQPD